MANPHGKKCVVLKLEERKQLQELLGMEVLPPARYVALEEGDYQGPELPAKSRRGVSVEDEEKSGAGFQKLSV